MLKVLSGNQIKEPVYLYKLKPDAWDNIIVAHPYMQKKQLKALPISNGNQLAEATEELRNNDFYSIFIFTKAGKAISYSRVSREVQYEILQGKTLIISRSKAVFLYSDRQLRLQ